MKIVLIIFAIVILILIMKSYLIKYDTIIAFTGGLGSGKSLLSVKMAIKLLSKNRGKIWRYNHLWHYLPWNLKKPKYNFKPMLYTSIPIYFNTSLFSKKEWSIKLTEEHLLLNTRIIEKSVVFIDEVGSFATQFDYKKQNIIDNFNEFIRLFRHYTKGGYLVINDQCSENIVLEIRRRINTVFNLMQFKRIFYFFYVVKVRNISISEEIKTIEQKNAEDNSKLLFGIMPNKKTYDTYCYSERYNGVPFVNDNQYHKLKKNILMTCRNEKVSKNVIEIEEE